MPKLHDVNEFTPLLKQPQQGVKAAVQNRQLVLMLLCAALMATGAHFAKSSMTSLEPYILEYLHIDNQQFGLLLSLLFVPGLFSPFIGKAIDHFGFAKCAVTGLLCLISGQMLFVYSLLHQSFFLAAFSRVITGFGSATIVIVQRSAIAYYFQGKWLMFAMSTSVAMANLANIVGKASEAPILETYGKMAGLGFAVLWAGLSLLWGLGFAFYADLTDRYKKAVVRHSAGGIALLKRSRANTEMTIASSNDSNHPNNRLNSNNLNGSNEPYVWEELNVTLDSAKHLDPDPVNIDISASSTPTNGKLERGGASPLRFLQKWLASYFDLGLAFWLLNVLHASELNSFHLFSNVSAEFYVTTFGFHPTKAGFLSSLSNSFQLLAPLFGYLVDFSGHRLLIAAGCALLMTLSYTLFLLGSLGLYTPTFVPLVPIFLMSLSSTITLPLVLALVPSAVPARSFGSAFALLEVTSALFAIVGNYLVGYLSVHSAITMMCFFVGLALLCFVLIVTFALLIGTKQNSDLQAKAR